MAGPGTLLELACRRLSEFGCPAYIKDADLCYVAVNEEYASYFNLSPEAFVGRTSSVLFGASLEENREDKERRALVFGTEEKLVRLDARGREPLELQIESFICESEEVFILGLTRNAEAAPDARKDWHFDTAESDLEQIRKALENAEHPIGVFAPDGRALLVNAAYRSQASSFKAQAGSSSRRIIEVAAEAPKYAERALDLMRIGLCVYDQENRLVYANEPWRAIYRSAIGEIEVGTSLAEIAERLYDTYLTRQGVVSPDRQAWIEHRVKTYATDGNDFTDHRSDGLALRILNKRLENGFLIGLRIDVSDARAREQNLTQQMEQTQLFRQILEDLPVAAFVRDQDHRLVYGNNSYAVATGADVKASLGKTEVEMFGPAGEEFLQRNQGVLQKDGVVEVEQDIVDSEGYIRTMMTRITRVETAMERSFVVGSMTDVTVLKQREQELLKARGIADDVHRDLEQFLQSMPVGVLILDADYCVEYTNAAFGAMWDFPEKYIFKGKSLRDIIALLVELGLDGDVEQLYQSRVRTIKGIRSKEQEEVSLINNKVLILETCRISEDRILMSFSDITFSRRQEQEISEARVMLEKHGEMMKETVRAMSQGLLIAEGDIVLTSNTAFAEMMRIPATLVAPGKSVERAFMFAVERGDLGEEPLRIREEWSATLRSEKSLSTVLQIAAERWIQLDITITKASRKIIIATDVTEIKEREEELHRLLARSEAADRAKSEFLANMSHEIRTPMNGVLGMAELLARTSLDTRQKTFVDIIVKSGNALLTIINDILDFSKIDAQQMTLRRMPFNAGEAVEDVVTLLSSSAAEKDIDLLVRVAPDLPNMLIGDAGRFRQIVTNLVGNSIKFTERGHVLVDLYHEPGPKDEVIVGLRVTDTGSGIPPEKLDAIFDKFAQADTSSTRRHEGTGLGLSITAGLVDLFDGFIEVESEVGVGSTFTVHLPMPRQQGLGMHRSTPVNVKGARVLTIDDNEINRRILAEQLDLWGFEGAEAADGATALAILKIAYEEGIPVDVILLDYHMRDMTGAEVTRAIRADARLQATPIIFLTSMDVSAKEKDFITISGQAHLMKPTRGNVLRNTIIDVLRNARQQGAPIDIGRQTSESGSVQQGNSSIVKLDVKKDERPRKLEILVAEDNEVNQIVFTQILQATGLTFLVVKNGQEAVEAWRQLRPSLILMDVSMPILSGHEAARLIRELESGEADVYTPIIGVTAHALEADKAACLAAGMDDYLAKPISPEMLEGKIQRWLSGTGLRGKLIG